MFEPTLVEVAVDAVGAAGGRTYTYAVPERLAGLEPGEAVIVEFGRRQALGVVLGPVAAADGPTGDLKPIAERVRSDGPLLPPLQLALARVIAEHYLAPAAMVIRAALPPGTLERLDYVARPTDRASDAALADPATLASGLERRQPGDAERAQPVDTELLARVVEAGPNGVAVARLTGAHDRAATSGACGRWQTQVASSSPGSSDHRRSSAATCVWSA